MSLNQEVLKAALDNDICTPWAKMIEDAKGVDELLQMYIDGIDFCLEHDFPSKNYLKEHAQDRLKHFGIYVDEDIAINNPAKLVLLGNCKAKASVNGYVVSQQFIKHSSKLELMCNENSFVLIDIFDTAHISVEANGNCKVLVNVYGAATVTTLGSGQIKIVKKNKATY